MIASKRATSVPALSAGRSVVAAAVCTRVGGCAWLWLVSISADDMSVEFGPGLRKLKFPCDGRCVRGGVGSCGCRAVVAGTGVGAGGSVRGIAAWLCCSGSVQFLVAPVIACCR